MSVDEAKTVNIEIWSDVVCPWCYIGKRRFERAVAELATGDEPVKVNYVFRPYQLDPTADPNRSGPVFDAYVKKFGGHEQAQKLIDNVTTVAAEEGLGFRMDRALRANTLLAHRLIWFAEQPASGVDHRIVKERLMQAYFVDGLDIGDRSTLVEMATQVGLDGDDVTEFLASDAGKSEVAALLESAAEHGITAVPTFVVEGQWAIPGAQDSATFVQTLRRIAAR